MRCGRCGSTDTSVLDSRSDGEAIRRRRVCDQCDFRFTTYERAELSLPVIVKKDGRREPFDRQKVRAGLVRACEKRPVSVETIEHSVDAIEVKLQELCVPEVPSRQIGDIVMEQLKSIDKIAYVRFASVYREFSDVSQFVDTLQSLVDEPERSRPARSTP